MKKVNISIPGLPNHSITELRYEDDHALTYHINDKVIYDNTLQIPYPYYIEDAKQFIKGTHEFTFTSGRITNFAIREGKALIGCIGVLYNHGIDAVRTELGFWIGADYRGKGIMAKTVPAFCDYIFANTQIRVLEANVFLHNKPSQNLLKKCGFINRGIQRDAFLKDGEFVDAAFLELER